VHFYAEESNVSMGAVETSVEKAAKLAAGSGVTNHDFIFRMCHVP
jgi:hypothetical protein